MALADYYLCDKCDRKTIYDAALHYDDCQTNPRTHKRWPNGRIGWMYVLCPDCAPELEAEILAVENKVELLSRNERSGDFS